MKPVIFDFKIFLINDNQNENLNKIKFRSPETRNNNIIIPIKINEKDKKYIPLIFKTPKMYMPFKPHISNSQGGYIRLAFDNIKIDSNLKDFYNFINTTESYLEDKLNKSGMIVLNNNSNKNKSKITFKKTIQKSEGYADYFNLNFNMNDITIYDNDLSLISIDNVNCNFYAYFIIELTGFYYKQKTKEIKLIWSLVQFKLDKVKNKIQECLFLDEEELEKETLKTLKDIQIQNLKEEEKKVNFIKNHILLEKFFKMLSIGIPKIAVQHKMSLSNIDIRFLDYSSDTNIDKLPIELKNKLNDINIDDNDNNDNNDNNITNDNNQNDNNMNLNINENNKSNNLNKQLLSNIKNHKFKNINININSIEHKSLKNKIIEKLSNKSLLVPSLEQINDAYKKLNKVNKKSV